MQLLGTSSRQSADVLAGRSVRDPGAGPSSASLDETLPFPPPLGPAAPPRRAAARQEQEASESNRGAARALGPSLEQLTEASLARAHREEHAPASEPPEPPRQATLALAPSPVTLGRLHWRGRELSPEFHEYALRVARGEQLAPFRGQLLADESQPLPWESADSRPLRSKVPRVVGLLLVALSIAAIVTSSSHGPEELPAGSAPAPAAAAAVVVAALEPAPPPITEAPPSGGSPSAGVAEPAPTAALPDPTAALPDPAAALPAPPPVRKAAPRKTAAPAPTAPAASGTSLLLVEKPPF